MTEGDKQVECCFVLLDFILSKYFAKYSYFDLVQVEWLLILNSDTNKFISYHFDTPLRNKYKLWSGIRSVLEKVIEFMGKKLIFVELVIKDNKHRQVQVIISVKKNQSWDQIFMISDKISYLTLFTQLSLIVWACRILPLI